MKIFINGEAHEFSGSLTLRQLLAALDYEVVGLAIAINQTIVPSSDWETSLLQPGDRVALFRAIAGG